MARRARVEGEEALRPKQKKMRGGDMLDGNPGNEDKAEFRKITVTIPPAAYEQLIFESARRKIAGKPNQLLSSLLREAVEDYLKRLEDEKSRSDYSAVQA